MIRLFIVLTIFFFSCNNSNEKKKTIESDTLVKELISNDFLHWVDSNKYDSIENSIVKSLDFYSADLSRYANIDAEELSEGNFDFFMPTLNEILGKRKVKITVEKTENFESGYEININGLKVSLYSEKDLENYRFWDIAPRNFFKTMNIILENNNLNERFYLLYEGNDLGVMILTEKQLEIFQKIYINDTKEIPYKP